MDCQGLVARLVLDFVLLTTAVEVASRWRELAEKLARVSRQQMEAYEAPHRDKNGLLDNEVNTRTILKFLNLSLMIGLICLRESRIYSTGKYNSYSLKKKILNLADVRHNFWT